MTLVDLLTRPIAYHPVLARLLGSVPAAVMLSQAIYWQQRVPKERPPGCPGPGWWYHTIAEWESETALKRHDQLTARKILKKTSFWNEEKKGIPAKLWFWVDFSELGKVLQSQKIAVPRQTCLPQNRRQDGRYAAGRSAVSRQTSYTEITSQITTTSHSDCDEKQVVSSSSLSSAKTSELEDQEDYLRLVQNYGGIHSPAGFEATKKQQWEEQGGMSPADLQQLSEWRMREERSLAKAKAKEEQLLEQEQCDQQQAAEALDKETNILSEMSPDLRHAIMSARCGGGS